MIEIHTGELSGYLPTRVLSHVEEWRVMRQTELLGAWESAQAGVPPGRIEPLERDDAYC